MKAGYSIILNVILASTMMACGQDSSPLQDDLSAVSVEDPVLAIVGNSQIRNSQLTVLLERLPEEAVDTLDAKTRKSMVESLVSIRAIADEAQAQLTDEERMLVDAKVQAYRDELLAQSYLKSNVTPTPVTHEMVTSYYHEHQHEFTEQGRVRYQYLSVAKDSLDDLHRSRVLTAFGGAKDVQDWQALAAGLNKDGIAVQFKAANVKPEQIATPLAVHIARLDSAMVSDLIFEEQIMVIKLIERGEDNVKPLTMVSAQIRKMLAPMQVKKSVAEVSQEILSNTPVEYMKGG